MKPLLLTTTILACLIGFLIPSPAQAAELDSYGGFTDIKGEKTGFFHAEKIDGRWWMVTPEGNGFFGIGLSHPLTDMSKAAVISGYGNDQKKWMTDSVSQMRDLGYNCVWTGPQTTDRNRSRWVEEATAERIYTEQRYPHAIHVPIIKHMVELKPGEIRPDVFSDEYKNHVRKLVVDKVVPKKDDPWVIGWFYGFGSFMKDFEWVNQTLAREPGSSGRKRLIEVLAERYAGDIEELNRVYGTGFASFKDFHKSGHIEYPSWVTFAKWNPARMPTAPLDLVKLEDAEALFGEIAEQVYAFAYDEIRRHDTNHMILGSYVKSDTYTLDIWKRLAPYIDLVAPQAFSSRYRALEIVKATGLPALISDQVFGHVYPVSLQGKLEHSGLPDHVDQQVVYEHMAKLIAADPHFVGISFCACLYDQSDLKPGSKLGQRGFIDNNAKPYQPLCNAVREINDEILQAVRTPLNSKAVDQIHDELNELQRHYRFIMSKRKAHLREYVDE